MSLLFKLAVIPIFALLFAVQSVGGLHVSRTETGVIKQASVPSDYLYSVLSSEIIWERTNTNYSGFTFCNKVKPSMNSSICGLLAAEPLSRWIIGSPKAGYLKNQPNYYLFALHILRI